MSYDNIITMDDLNDLLKSNLIYNRRELQWYGKFNRFGALDPYNNLSQTKEYLFFTKPDCHIFTPGQVSLQPALANDPFFIDAANRYPHVIQQLQSSAGFTGNGYITKNPFMALLSNSVKNTIDFQALNASTMDGPVNMYGSSISYRKDAWAGDENVEFSLEFEDSRFLEVYMLTRIYEEYERYNSVGLIYPPNIDGAPETGTARHNFNYYIRNKALHDVFGIYRIIVGEDYETIIYYAYICGATITNVPRDAFNDMKNGEGLTFSVDFKAYCILDMDPRILTNFNTIIMSSYGDDMSGRQKLPIYGTVDPDTVVGKSFKENIEKERYLHINGDWASFPYIERVNRTSSSSWYGSQGMAYQYKLQWYR